MTTRRWAIAVAGPVVVSLLLASWLLWTRSSPARNGGFCTRAGVQVAAFLAPELDATSGGDIAAFPELLDTLATTDRLDPDALRPGAPADVEPILEELAAARAAFRSDVSDARRRNGSSVSVPPEMVRANSALLAAYDRHCLATLGDA